MAHTIDTKLGGASGPASKPLGIGAKVRRVIYNVLNFLVIIQERAEQRKVLGELDERMLKDIGVSRSDAYRESVKPFWQP
ncbi:MAG: DUF1127 domain-containing protein [Rhodospirillaceae bacterium]|nr:DUF1127 domain-containing protein [Rhodospirillaceae bacterium]